jgi:molecular chaperone HscC
MIIGIDLGTSNSAVAVWRDGQPVLIPNSLGQSLTPSAVSVDKDGTVLVGLPARERLITHSDATAVAFKRYMGTDRVIRLGGRNYHPHDLSALVLRNLKADAEAFLGEPVTEAVITVPAYFNDKQRKATRKAGELAGLRVERLLNEPTAAAIAYGMHRLASDTRFLVFDLGGGTFDVSILEIFDGVIEVRSSTGDNHLGGEDFNEAIVDAVFARWSKEWKVSRKDEVPTLYQLVRDQCERARRKLTTQPNATLNIAWQGRDYEFTLDQDQFEKLTEKLLARLRDPVLQALRDIGVRNDSINEIVLAGGATRMPLVRQAVTRMFGRFPAAQLNPDEVVALGAAVQAGLKMRDASLKEVVVTDVCPYSLGVDVTETRPDGSVRSGIYSPIIERNTVIPASRSKAFVTMQNRQSVVKFNIYQGESRLVQDNVHLGQIEIPVPPRAAHEVQVECRFTYDINGLLEVDVHVPDTNESRQLVIVGDDTPPDEATLQKRRAELASLKVHPRDADENRAALARASRCYEQFLGDKREFIGRALAEFESIMEQQNPRIIANARETLHQRLDQIEGERFL